MDGKYGVNTEGRDAKDHFSTGNPQGARHKATLAALTLLSGEAEGLTRKAVELALADCRTKVERYSGGAGVERDHRWSNGH